MVDGPTQVEKQQDAVERVLKEDKEALQKVRCLSLYSFRPPQLCWPAVALSSIVPCARLSRLADLFL